MLNRDRWWHREIERMRREHNAQVQTLIETIAHLSGKPLPAGDPIPWLPPEPRQWTAAPEQMPLDD